MKTIKIIIQQDIPKNYTGIAEYINGDKLWLLNGKRHRKNGPAIEYINGDKAWFLNDKIHREDGPALEYANGDKKYYLNGNHLNKEKIEQLIGLDYPTKIAIKLSSFTNGKT